MRSAPPTRSPTACAGPGYSTAGTSAIALWRAKSSEADAREDLGTVHVQRKARRVALRRRVVRGTDDGVTGADGERGRPAVLKVGVIVAERATEVVDRGA